MCPPESTPALLQIGALRQLRSLDVYRTQLYDRSVTYGSELGAALGDAF